MSTPEPLTDVEAEAYTRGQMYRPSTISGGAFADDALDLAWAYLEGHPSQGARLAALVLAGYTGTDPASA